MLRTTMLVLLLSCVSTAQSMRDDMTPLGLAYELKVLDDTQTLEVTLHIKNAKRQRTHVAMPNWTPGSYRPRRFGEWVSDLTVSAQEAGTAVPFEKIDPLTWSIDTSTHSNITVRYKITPRRRRFTPIAPREGRKMTGMHYEGPATFMYVKGHERGTPVTCRYILPQGWQVANGMLFGDDPNFRHARDYDTFADCPTIVGIFDRVDFKINETPFSCAFWNPQGSNDWDLKKFANEVVKPICRDHGRIFGSFPFPRYVFLFTVSPFGGGGLEHLSSTSIGLSTRSMSRNVVSGASITSHEFFHTWNVKRIRPATLGPFEYQHENYTGNLWVAEGWTSYYGDLTLARLGMTDEDQYLRSIASIAARELSKPRRKEHSVYWASRDIWHASRTNEKGSRRDYYGYGELMGLLIDLKIRDVTDNQKSLDDVLRFLNRWFAERDVGYEEDDIERACTAISNYDFSEFFARYITGTMDPPLADFFALAGLDFESTQLKADFPFFAGKHKDGLSVRVARREGEAAGLKRGDIITAINGKKVTDAPTFLVGQKGGTEVTLTVKREGEGAEEVGDVKIKLRDRVRTITTLTRKANPSEKQKRIYDSWMKAN